MSRVDWNVIISADKRSIERDPESFIEMVDNVNPNEISNVKQLRQLFVITRSLVNIKDCQLDEAIKITMQEAKNQAYREIQEKKRKQLYDLEAKKGNSSHLINYGDDDAESQINKLTHENLQLERELKLQREIAEKYSNEITHLSRTKESIRQEKNMMRVDLNDYKSQVHLQWEHFLQKMSEDLQRCKENLTYKDKKLKVSTVEIENLNSAIRRHETINNQHLFEIETFKKKLKKLKECNVKLEKVLQEEDAVNKELIKENKSLKEEIAKANEREQSRATTDDAIVDLVDKKVGEWMKFIESLKKEVEYYKSGMQTLKQQMENEKEHSKPSSIRSLSQIISEKDKIIDNLKKAREYNTNLLEHKGRFSTEKLWDMSTKEPDMVTLQEQPQNLWINWRDQIIQAQKCREEAERHALLKDKELHKVQTLLKKYENQYGMDEARREIDCLERKLQINDRKVENLVKLLNREIMTSDYDSLLENTITQGL